MEIWRYGDGRGRGRDMKIVKQHYSFRAGFTLVNGNMEKG